MRGIAAAAAEQHPGRGFELALVIPISRPLSLWAKDDVGTLAFTEPVSTTATSPFTEAMVPTPALGIHHRRSGRDVGLGRSGGRRILRKHGTGSDSHEGGGKKSSSQIHVSTPRF